MKPVGAFSLKGSLPVGLYAALQLLRTEIVLCRRHRAGVRGARAYAEKNGLKLNIGCGANRKEGWLNIDLLHDAADLSLDMREHIPLRAGTVEIIYLEHFLECLEYPGDVKRFLRECQRLLEPRGILRVGVGNTRGPLLDYLGFPGGGYIPAAEAGGWHPDWCRTRMDHLNYYFRGWRVRYRYDFTTIREILEETGFIEITETDFDPKLDNPKRAFIEVTQTDIDLDLDRPCPVAGTLYINALMP